MLASALMMVCAFNYIDGMMVSESKCFEGLMKMKIMKTTLEKIIREEVSAVLLELNPYHDRHTGRLSGPTSGNSYSLSEPAVARAGWDKEKAKKGKVTSKGNVSYRFGMAKGKKACGRKDVTGAKTPKKYSCADYPQKYDEEVDHPLVPSVDDSESDRLDKLGLTHHLRALGKGIVRLDEIPVDSPDVFISLDDLVDILDQLRPEPAEQQVVENQSDLAKKCRQMGFTTGKEAFQNLAATLNTLKRAEDGKLYEPQKQN
jgi:hypothetical protein